MRVDVVFPERSRQPDDADLVVAASPGDVVRVLPGDVDGPPPCVDRLMEAGECPLWLPLFHEVGPALFEVLLLSEEQVPEKFVLLVREQERPRKQPHRNRLAIRRSRFIRIVSRIEAETYRVRMDRIGVPWLPSVLVPVHRGVRGRERLTTIHAELMVRGVRGAAIRTHRGPRSPRRWRR